MRRRLLLGGAGAAALALAACTRTATEPSAPSGSGGSDAGGPGPNTSPSPDAPSTTPAPQSPLERHAARLDALSPRELAGQLVWTGVIAGSALPESAFRDARSGGMFLLGRWESAAEVRTIRDAVRTAGTTASGIAPLLAVDQEGGQVQVLRGDAAEDTPSAAFLGGEGPPVAGMAYESIGRSLADLGIGMDLAPVADVVDPALGDDNGPVGALNRGFGTDPTLVGACVEEAVRGLAAHEVTSALKHFPGLGRVRENTDFSADGILDETTRADDPYLEPFARGIDAGAAAVMLSSATYLHLDPDAPAMFSRAVVTDLLRGSLGFDGLVITDDIGAAASVQSVPVGERATRLLEAGGDVVLTADPDLTGELVDAIEQWAAASEDHAQRVRQSVARLMDVKEPLGLLG